VRRPSGFTLLEVVLAMVILALMSAICYGAFHVAIRAVERGEVAVVTAQRLRSATDVMIRQVKSTVAYPVQNEDEDVYPFFVGQPQSMTFVTANGLLGGGGLARVRYYVQPDPLALVLEEDPYFSPADLGEMQPDEPGLAAAVLLDGFRGLQFQYLLDDGADLEWRNDWDGYEEDLLPSAVRIMIEGLPGLELDVWGQEIPIMVTTYGDANGEVDEGDIGGEDDDENLDGDDDDNGNDDDDDEDF
jgi:prepilin-type N-terminal cleavage/methylation domain-containing protein